MARKPKAKEHEASPSVPLTFESAGRAIYHVERFGGYPVLLDMQDLIVVLDKPKYDQLVASGIGFSLLYWHEFDGGRSGILAVPMA